jgi:hypothetical protein
MFSAALGALEPGKGEEDERHNQRAQRMPFVHMRGASFKPRKEGGKAACGRKPVQGGERKGHEAEKAGEQGQMLCHADACVAEERAGAASVLVSLVFTRQARRR